MVCLPSNRKKATTLHSWRREDAQQSNNQCKWPTYHNAICTIHNQEEVRDDDKRRVITGPLVLRFYQLQRYTLIYASSTPSSCIYTSFLSLAFLHFTRRQTDLKHLGKCIIQVHLTQAEEALKIDSCEYILLPSIASNINVDHFTKSNTTIVFKKMECTRHDSPST